MKRIAITGSLQSGTSVMTNALAAMTGFDVAVRPPYSLSASKYRLDPEIEKCQWPDSFVYCLGAFTDRMITEQRYADRFISEGSVLHELVWIKCRFPHHEPIYEQSMITGLERVVAEYASGNYDHIFHIDALHPSDVFDQCIKRLYARYGIRYLSFNGIDREATLERMADCLSVKPVLSAKHALMKATEYDTGEYDFYGDRTA